MTDIYTTKIAAAGPTGVLEGAELIKNGEIVAIPTETVYGLGADAMNPDAVDKIFQAKGRPSDNPMIVHVANIDQVDPLVDSISDTARALMEAFWPGPLTLIMKKSESVPSIVTASLDTVAVRMPQHEIAIAFIQSCDCPLAAPSANQSGKPSPTNAEQVYEDMNGRIPLILDGGPCRVGIESTVLDISGEVPIILRPGAVTREMLADIIPDVEMDPAVLAPLKSDEQPKSPGTKYKHYAPNADLVVVEGAEVAISRYICKAMMDDRRQGIDSVVLCYQESQRNYVGKTIILGSRFRPNSVAENIFNALRQIDQMQCTKAYVEGLEPEGMALAVMNRLYRAAGHQRIQVD